MNWKRFCDEVLADIDKALSHNDDGAYEPDDYIQCLEEIKAKVVKQKEHAWPPTPPQDKADQPETPPAAPPP